MKPCLTNITEFIFFNKLGKIQAQKQANLTYSFIILEDLNSPMVVCFSQQHLVACRPNLIRPAFFYFSYF